MNDDRSPGDERPRKVLLMPDDEGRFTPFAKKNVKTMATPKGYEWIELQTAMARWTVAPWSPPEDL